MKISALRQWLVFSVLLLANGLALARTPIIEAQRVPTASELMESIRRSAPEGSKQTESAGPASPESRGAKDSRAVAQEYHEVYMQKLADRRYFVTLISALSVVSLVMVVFLLRKTSPKAEDIVVVTGLNLVVFGTLIIVLTVEVQEQLAAATGILGAMGGYLFGASRRGRQERRDTNDTGGRGINGE